MQDKNSGAYKAQKKFLQEQSAMFIKHSNERTSINIMYIGCSSTSLDDEVRRIPSTHNIMEKIAKKSHDIDPSVTILTNVHILEDMNFDHCEGNYSIQGSYCTWPCRISQKKMKDGKVDPLTKLYNDLTDWCDICIIATPIRWGNASSLYYKLVERMNAIENQKEVYGVDLIYNKLIGMVIVGAQDGAQHVMGQIMATWSQLGFAFAKSPYVAYTAGGLHNDRTDLVGEQLIRDQGIIDIMITEMLTHQFETIFQRRK